MIGVQLVIAGYQLPARYSLTRWKEMALCLLPIMTAMWLCTATCVLLTIPNITFLAALVIGSCVTSTDPILSQAIAKGPLADKYVARPLREIISAEAGANHGFSFPFLMLATYLIQHADIPGAGARAVQSAAAATASDAASSVVEHGAAPTGQAVAHALMARADEVSRLGGGVTEALMHWFVETWLYTIALSIAYGALVGFGACKVIKFALKQ